MRITVAIPCYNLEDRISACLESVITQDYKDIEILIIDDCSTDNSVEIIKDLIDRHPEREFRFIINEINIGLNKVRNLAIDEAHGETLFFVDGDDTIEPGTLSLFHRRMEETNVDVVCGSFRKKDFDGNTYLVKQFPEDTIKGAFAYATYIEKYIDGYFRISVWNNLYRLDFLRSHNIKCDTHYRNYEDCLFTFKVVLNAHSINYVHECTYNYCDYPNSILHQKVDQRIYETYRAIILSVFDAKQDFVDSHKDRSLPDGVKFLLNNICLTGGLLKRCMDLGEGKKEKVLLLKWLRETYQKNGISLSNIVGTYNTISYLILISPFSYQLFRFYLRNVKTIAKFIRIIQSPQRLI